VSAPHPVDPDPGVSCTSSLYVSACHSMLNDPSHPSISTSAFSMYSTPSHYSIPSLEILFDCMTNNLEKTEKDSSLHILPSLDEQIEKIKNPLSLHHNLTLQTLFLCCHTNNLPLSISSSKMCMVYPNTTNNPKMIVFAASSLNTRLM